MDFTAWKVDLSALSASHESGFTIQIEGNPKDPSSVSPGRFPPTLNGVDQARLLRHGMEAIAKAAAAVKTKPAAPKKPAYVPPANKPKRPVLSLKKREQA
ncbi:hypothetical protein FKG94_24840 [Exilibacterium tricleocarpae]|uniref:Uncharacterized protein n=1 Tax=Exilibacterium tricleocarpae TaxID=2591008 RepID=A0A545SS15_9GAMM|nr:hypothetical protein [Exilibacterium tricleocarpae]TQV67761.1 hypothetical protein FKG94_24840 [Exilibacterium tricleocarpae]